MKIEVTEISSIVREMAVVVPAEKVDAEFDKAFHTLKRSVTLRGFRAGHVPMNMVKRMYKDRVEDEVAGNLIAATLPEAFLKEKLMPVSEPHVDKNRAQQGEEFSYKARFEIRPTIEVPDYSGIEITRQIVRVKDEEVTNELKRMQQNMMQMEPIEDHQDAQKGDVAVIDFTGTMEGKPFKGGTAKDFPLEVGGGRFIPGFEEQLEGLEIDQHRTVTVTFPENYQSKDLAGKEALFEVTLKGLKREVLPELNDDFAKDLGEFETLEALKNKIIESLSTQKEQATKREMQQQLMDKLSEITPFEVPNMMIENQLNYMVEEAKYRFKIQGVDITQAGMDWNSLSKEWRKDAEKKVRELLTLEALSDQEEIEVSEEDINQFLAEVAEKQSKNLAQLKAFYSKENRMEGLKVQIRQTKTLDFLMGRVNIKEVEENFTETTNSGDNEAENKEDIETSE